ncbi:MAG: WYL domain-containing protein [Prosthecobacter sp.]
MKTLLLSLLALLIVASCSPPATVDEVITQAIKNRRTVVLQYDDGKDAGLQVVEPHVLGTTGAGNHALRAWFLRTVLKSEKQPGWRTYRLDKIRTIELAEPFDWPRPDHDPTGGKIFKSVDAAL